MLLDERMRRAKTSDWSASSSKSNSASPAPSSVPTPGPSPSPAPSADPLSSLAASPLASPGPSHPCGEQRCPFWPCSRAALLPPGPLVCSVPPYPNILLLRPFCNPAQFADPSSDLVARPDDRSLSQFEAVACPNDRSLVLVQPRAVVNPVACSAPRSLDLLRAALRKHAVARPVVHPRTVRRPLIRSRTVAGTNTRFFSQLWAIALPDVDSLVQPRALVDPVAHPADRSLNLLRAALHKHAVTRPVVQPSPVCLPLVQS